MKLKPKSEMRKLIWSFTIPTLLLVALIVITYLAIGIVNANNNAKQTKKLVVEQAIRSYGRFAENFKNLSGFSPQVIQQFNPSVIQSIFRGDYTQLYNLAKDLMLLVSPSEYVAVIKDGKIVASNSPAGTTIDPKGLPLTVPKGDYVMLDRFNNKKGDFLDFFVNVDLSKLGFAPGTFAISSVIDLTDQIKKVDQYFQDQKKDTIIGLVITGIIALVLFALLSTFWLRYLVNKYIRRPVAELNSAAQKIAAGTYEGEVVVDENSDFAALQGLLKSGQLILSKFDEKMEDKD
jgi:hypothetical protein